MWGTRQSWCNIAEKLLKQVDTVVSGIRRVSDERTDAIAKYVANHLHDAWTKPVKLKISYAGSPICW